MLAVSYLISLGLTLMYSITARNWGSSEDPSLRPIFEDKIPESRPCWQTIIGEGGKVVRLPRSLRTKLRTTLRYEGSRSPTTVWRWHKEVEDYWKYGPKAVRLKGHRCELAMVSMCTAKKPSFRTGEPFFNGIADYVGHVIERYQRSHLEVFHAGDLEHDHMSMKYMSAKSPARKMVFIVIPCTLMGTSNQWNLKRHDGNPLVWDKRMQLWNSQPLIAVLLLSNLASKIQGGSTGHILLLQSQKQPCPRQALDPPIIIAVKEKRGGIPTLVTSHPHFVNRIRWTVTRLNLNGDRGYQYKVWLYYWMKELLLDKFIISHQPCKYGQQTFISEEDAPYVTFAKFHTPSLSVERITYGRAGFSFLSCAKAESSLRYEMYHVPLMSDLWVGLGVTFLSLCTFHLLWERFVVDHDPVDIGRVVVLILSSLIDDCAPMPSALNGRLVFRITLGLWLLISTVLSAGYIGVVINFVNLPPARKAYDLWESLPCLHDSRVDVGSWPTWRYRISEARRWAWLSLSTLTADIRRRRREDPRDECTEVYSEPHHTVWHLSQSDKQPGMYNLNTWPNEFMENVLHALEKIVERKKVKMGKWELSVLYGLTRYFVGVNRIPRYHLGDPGNLAHYLALAGRKFAAQEERRLTEKRLAQCKHTAFSYYRFTGSGEDPEFEYFKKTYPDAPWYRNVDEKLFLSEFKYIIMDPPHNSSVPTYFRWMQDTGAFTKGVADVIARLTRQNQKLLKKRSRPREGAERLSLHNSSFATTLVLAFSAFGAACLAHCVEELFGNWKVVSTSLKRSVLGLLHTVLYILLRLKNFVETALDA